MLNDDLDVMKKFRKLHLVTGIFIYLSKTISHEKKYTYSINGVACFYHKRAVSCR
jgi:hypothetical protein